MSDTGPGSTGFWALKGQVCSVYPLGKWPLMCVCVCVCVWAGLGWAGLGWAGLGWAGLGWADRATRGTAGRQAVPHYAFFTGDAEASCWTSPF